MAINGAALNGATVSGTKIQAAQFTDFLLALTYTGAAVSSHWALVQTDDAVAGSLQMPLVGTGLAGNQAWLVGTLWIKWGKADNVQIVQGTTAVTKDPLLVSGPYPCTAFQIQITSAAGVGTVTARLWAATS